MQVIRPQTVSLPPAEQDLYVVRGDVFEFNMGFLDAADIAETLSQRLLRLGFRRTQNDNVPNLLTVNAQLEADPGDEFRGKPVDIMASFSVSPNDTQQLPQHGCVYFIEWTDVLGGSNRRIVQGRVIMGD